MEANYVHKDSTTLVQDKLVKNELNQIELQYNALKQQKFNELLKENQELKEKINGVDEERTYLYNKLSAENEQLNSLVNSCQEEIRRLKKQLEELKSINKVLSEELTKDKILKQDCLTTCCGIPIGDIPKLINQQKEFIEYMTKTIEELECDDFGDEDMKGYLIQRIDTFKEILSKYKEIIGDKE